MTGFANFATAYVYFCWVVCAALAVLRLTGHLVWSWSYILLTPVVLYVLLVAGWAMTS